MDAPRKAARLTLSVEGDALVAELSDAPDREIADAGGREALPGRVVRREGQAPSGDVAADEAYEGLGATFDLYSEVFGRNSIDGAGLPLRATVHYGHLYDNAFWDGERMVFGDGDGEVFDRFTRSLSVIGHELTHGVTQFASGLVYRRQPGALNESISDVFGALVEQYAAGQTSEQASWLIGAGLFTPAVQGEALRSMRHPGTSTTTSRPTRTTAGCTSTRASPTARSCSWPTRSAVTPGSVPGASGTTPSRDRCRPTSTSPASPARQRQRHPRVTVRCRRSSMRCAPAGTAWE
jgi:Zn-dependent metalloprotease